MDVNRRLKREAWSATNLTVEGPVKGNIEIAKGDLVFLDRIDGLRTRGVSTANYAVYPFSNLSGLTLTLASNRTLAAENFLGVAAWHSDSGVTETISVFIEGLFKFDLKHSSYTKIGHNVYPTGSGVTLYNQTIGAQDSIENAIGKVAKSARFANKVEMFIRSRIMRGQILE